MKKCHLEYGWNAGILFVPVADNDTSCSHWFIRSCGISLNCSPNIDYLGVCIGYIQSFPARNVCFIHGWGLQFLFGKGILASYKLFMPIVWVTIMTAMIWIVSSLLIAIRQIIWLLIGIIVDFFICLVLVQPCDDKYGSNGTSVVQLIVYAIFVIYSLRLWNNTV